MRCDIENVQTVTLTLDVATFAVMQQALVHFVDSGLCPPGSPARDLMWKFTTHLKALSAPAAPAPATVVEVEKPVATLPANPVDEVVTLVQDDAPPAPSVDWQVKAVEDAPC